MLTYLLHVVEGLRAVGELSRRVAAIEDRQRAVDGEWSDVLDKLAAREDRQRKRDKRRMEPSPEQAEFDDLADTPFLRGR